jgi:TrpR-related protein YerC/YecD
MGDGDRHAESVEDLMRAILSLDTPDEVQRFLTDLCTPKELSSMVDRWRVARLVDQSIPYRTIHERTGVSTATITRVARSLSCYRCVLDRKKRTH